jgi:hemerythrin-like domain-containing protein
VQRRTHDLDDTIAELHRQHDEDYQRVARLRDGFGRWQDDPAQAAPFVADARDYARFTMNHIVIEESRILHALPTLLTAINKTNHTSNGRKK